MTGPELASLGGLGQSVLVVTSAVLCPDCLGDWCAACDFTGMARPVEPVAVVHTLPIPAAAPVVTGEVAA